MGGLTSRRVVQALYSNQSVSLSLYPTLAHLQGLIVQDSASVMSASRHCQGRVSYRTAPPVPQKAPPMNNNKQQGDKKTPPGLTFKFDEF